MAFINVQQSDGRGPLTLNTQTIFKVRPLTSGSGSLIVCIGGAVHRVDDSHDTITKAL